MINRFLSSEPQVRQRFPITKSFDLGTLTFEPTPIVDIFLKDPSTEIKDQLRTVLFRVE